MFLFLSQERTQGGRVKTPFTFYETQCPCTYLIHSVINPIQTQVSFRKCWSLKRNKESIQSYLSTLALLSQILQMLKKCLFSTEALIDSFLKVLENTIRICTIPQAFIITMSISNRRTIFYLLTATEIQEEECHVCPFHKQLTPSTTSSCCSQG